MDRHNLISGFSRLTPLFISKSTVAYFHLQGLTEDMIWVLNAGHSSSLPLRVLICCTHENCTFRRQECRQKQSKGFTRSFLKDKPSVVERQGEGGRRAIGTHKIVLISVGFLCSQNQDTESSRAPRLGWGSQLLLLFL